MTVVTMSRAELARVETLAQVERGGLPIATVAALLEVSLRQMFRLLARFRAEGATGPDLAPARPAEQPPPAGRCARRRPDAGARALRRFRPHARGREA